MTFRDGKGSDSDWYVIWRGILLHYWRILLILSSYSIQQDSTSSKKRNYIWLPLYGLVRNSLKEPSSSFAHPRQPQKRANVLLLASKTWNQIYAFCTYQWHKHIFTNAEAQQGPRIWHFTTYTSTTEKITWMSPFDSKIKIIYIVIYTKNQFESSCAHAYIAKTAIPMQKRSQQTCSNPKDGGITTNLQGEN